MKILSISISDRLTKVLETDYKTESPKVYNSFAFKTPEGVFAEAGVTFQKEFAEIMLQHLAEHGISTRKALFVANSSKVASRTIEIPNVRENQIQKLLEENINDYFPMDIEQYQVAYRLESKKKISAGQNRKLFVLAAPKDLISSYYNLAQLSELEFVSLDYEGNSIYQAIKNWDTVDRHIFLEIGESTSTVTIVNGEEMEMQRTFYYGLGEAVDLIKDSPYCEGDSIPAQFKAIKLERFINYEGAVDDGDDQLRALRVEIMEVLQPIVGNITRILKYFNSQNPESPFAGCTLIGAGVYYKGLKELLSDELGVVVDAIDDDNTIMNRRAGLEKTIEDINLSSYIVSYGAVIDPMNLTLNKGKGEGKLTIIPGDSLMLGVLVCALALVASIALMISVMIPQSQLKRDITELENKRIEYAPAQIVQDQYVIAANSAQDLTLMDTLINTPANELALILDEMEIKLPTNSYVESISVDEAGITMTMNSASKREAAKVIEQLKTMTCFSEIIVSSLTSAENESGLKPVKYTVICSFPENITEEITQEGN